MRRTYQRFIAAVSLFGPMLHPGTRPRVVARTRSKAKLADRERAAPWFRSNNIVGVAVSRKTVGGTERGDLGLTFLVRRKLPKARLSETETIPSALKLESIAREMVTDVEECSRAPIAYGSPITSPGALPPLVRPVAPGASIGHPWEGGGTLGLLVRRDGSDHYLSCAHVLAPGGSGNVQVGDSIEQPADLNAQNPANVVGNVVEFTDVATEALDAAVAKANSIVHVPDIPGIGRPGAMLTQGAEDFTDDSMVLTMRGAVSGLVEGAVDGFGSFKMFYPDLGQEITLNGLIRFNAPTLGGDSGAAVCVKGSNPVTVAGLYVGSLSATQSLCFPAARVFNRLRLTLP